MFRGGSPAGKRRVTGEEKDVEEREKRHVELRKGKHFSKRRHGTLQQGKV